MEQHLFKKYILASAINKNGISRGGRYDSRGSALHFGSSGLGWSPGLSQWFELSVAN